MPTVHTRIWIETILILFTSLHSCDRGTGPSGQVCTKVIAQQTFPKATFFMFHFQTVGAIGAIIICE